MKRATMAALACGVVALSAAAYYYVPIWSGLLLPVPASPSETATAGARQGAPVPVKVAAVLSEDVPIYLSGIGTVQAYNTVNVQSRIDGEIMQIAFQEGQDVKQGDVLAVIDPRPLQAQLDQQIAMRQKNQALLDGAILDMKRVDTLILKDFATRQQVDQQHALVDQYKAQVINDEAQIDYARNQLNYTTIRAPIGGRVGIRQLDQGNFVRASDRATLVTITQLKPISVVFTLAAAAVGQTKLTLGQVNAPVAALGPDNSSELDRGVINLVDNQVDQSTGTIKLKATFPNNALKLWPGNFVNGRITVDVRRQAITVDAIAVRHGPRGDFVWVAKPDMTAGFRPVAVGQVFGGRALINRGVAKGEQVVTEGYYRLENGSRIEIDHAAPKPAAPGVQTSSSEPG
ncbi:efflux RND transporter periplasmic adaptor subunit [Tardiphaga sp.]|uniref:efflux RND transporter periplasmic adaptor subunit n=1 Tax=Tardiphaga sp. TaxID=1926292 RepID=UPI0025CE4B87|nr:efflux RND transporter periplasmic adaptor subunit [Tardiphaga sp.]